jgi:hypothetical protein
MREYMESDPVVWRFNTPKETDQDFMKYELIEVVSAEVNLDHWLKRTCGTTSHSLETYLFWGFMLRGSGKPRSIEP